MKKTLLTFMLALLTVLCIGVMILCVVRNRQYASEDSVEVLDEGYDVDESLVDVLESVDTDKYDVTIPSQGIFDEPTVVLTPKLNDVSDEDLAVANRVVDSHMLAYEKQLEEMLGVSCSPYLREAKRFEDIVYVTCGFKNTDAVVMVECDVSKVDTKYWFGGLCNVFGSDYPVVYFEYGVPDNSLEIYDALIASRVNEPCTTDYISGLDCTLENVTTGESVSISLGE